MKWWGALCFVCVYVCVCVCVCERERERERDHCIITGIHFWQEKGKYVSSFGITWQIYGIIHNRFTLCVQNMQVIIGIILNFNTRRVNCNVGLL